MQKVKDDMASIAAAEAQLNANFDHLGMTVSEQEAAAMKEQVKHLVSTQLTDFSRPFCHRSQFAAPLHAP